jgi:HlyD family secretion protein
MLTACERPADNAWLGYAEGETAMIAAPAAGWLSNLGVKRGDSVQLGQSLFRLDDTQQSATTEAARATLDSAQAEIAQARASLTYAQRDLTRQTNLVRENAGTQANLDLARSAYQAAVARIAQLEAQAKQNRATLTGANYQLSERSVTARTQGRVEDIFFREGEYVPAMTPVVAVLPPENIFVRFFVPETQFSKIKMGQKVAISCDGCATGITATISFIAAKQEFSPPVIYSVGNREKLVFKVEARADGGLKLNPGQPIQVRPL